MINSQPARLSICAIICTRNEYPYLKYLLPYIQRQDIDVVIVDHGSTDQTIDYVQSKWNCPVIGLFKMPFEGSFSLSRQLQLKWKIQNLLQHHWVVHHDADEIMQHRNGRSLREAIEEADREGYNVINFDEFVFLPKPNQDLEGRNYLREAKRYYYFATEPLRLQRVFKRSISTDNPKYNGHKIFDENSRIYPKNHTLRHYIGLSYQHLFDKYMHRNFDAEDIEKGWHRNRLNIDRKNLRLPNKHPYLQSLKNSSEILKRDTPTKLHFWEWVGE